MSEFNALPLCASPLSRDEAVRLETNMMPLLRFLGSPGDWGYDTKLGRLTIALSGLRAEIAKAREVATE